MPLSQIVVVRSLIRTDAASFAKAVTTAIAAATVQSCVSPALSSKADREMALADEIESKAMMPQGAGRLAEYARFYAEAPAGKIVGLYFRGVISDLQPGARRWVPREDVPSIDDGGCAVINIVFDLKMHKVESASCNGLA